MVTAEQERLIQEQAKLSFGSNQEQAIVFAQGARWAISTLMKKKVTKENFEERVQEEVAACKEIINQAGK